MGVSNMTLVKIAAIGGVATVTMGFALRFKINNNIKQSTFCKKALAKVRSHQGAVFLLGEPIRDCMIDVGNQAKNTLSETSGKYEIPLKGAKQRGVLYMWLIRENTNKDWEIERLELGVDSEPDRRLILK